MTERGAEVTVPGFPVKLSRTPPRLYRPPPGLGEHSDEVLGGAAGQNTQKDASGKR